MPLTPDINPIRDSLRLRWSILILDEWDRMIEQGYDSEAIRLALLDAIDPDQTQQGEVT